MSQKLWTKDGKVVVDANGKPILCEECPCGTPCASEVEALRQEAIAGGYEFHQGEFVSVDRRSGVSSTWLPPNGWSTYRAYYETHDGWEAVKCDCTRESIARTSGRTTRHLRFLSFPDACAGCHDNRELILMYPEIFGATGISYGTHAIYMYYESSGRFTPYIQPESTTYALDYRTFNCIIPWRESGGTVTGLMLISVLASSPDSFRTSILDTLPTTAHFSGEYRVPFGQDSMYVEYEGRSMLTGRTLTYAGNTPQEKTYFFSEAEAVAYASTTHTAPDGYYKYSSTIDGYIGAATRVTPPDTSAYSYPGWHEPRQGVQGVWDACDGYIGQRLRSTPSRSGSPGNIYCEQYITSNVGILVPGGNIGESLHVYGRGELPGTTQSSTDVWAPYDVLCPIDTDMHWCHPDLFGEDVP